MEPIKIDENPTVAKGLKRWPVGTSWLFTDGVKRTVLRWERTKHYVVQVYYFDHKHGCIQSAGFSPWEYDVREQVE